MSLAGCKGHVPPPVTFKDCNNRVRTLCNAASEMYYEIHFQLSNIYIYDSVKVKDSDVVFMVSL